MEIINQTESLLRQAEELSEQDKHAEALELLNKAGDAGDMEGAVCFVRGNIYLRMDQVTLADENYNLAVNKGFVDFRLYMNLADLCIRQGKTRQAELLCRQACELAPTETDPLNLIYLLRLQSGDLDGAMAAAGEMMERHPTQIDGFQLMAGIMLEAEMNEEAMELLMEIEERFSAHPVYILMRTAVTSRFDKNSEALAYLEEREKHFFDDDIKTSYLKERARLLAELGDDEKAEPLFRDLYQRGDREAGLALIGMLFRKNDLQEVLRLTGEMDASGEPGNRHAISILLCRTAAFSRLGDKAACRETLNRIIELLNEVGESLSLEMRFVRADAYEQLEEYEKAVAEFDAAVGVINKLEGPAPENLSSVLEQISEKRAAAASKIGSFI